MTKDLIVALRRFKPRWLYERAAHLLHSPRAGARSRRLIVHTGSRPGHRSSAAANGAVVDVFERAKAMVLSPAVEWRRIQPESGHVGYVFTNYVAFVAAIPPICMFLRRGVLGWAGPRLRHLHHGGFFSSLFGGIVHYLVTFVALYVMAVLIDGLARTFSAPRILRTL